MSELLTYQWSREAPAPLLEAFAWPGATPETETLDGNGTCLDWAIGEMFPRQSATPTKISITAMPKLKKMLRFMGLNHSSRVPPVTANSEVNCALAAFQITVC
jgi:hypothetical protein